jgi:uncharacterized protein (DUF983 family)
MSTIDFTHGDDLSDLLGGSVSAGPRVLPQAPELARIRDEKTGVVESCPKCRGTGRFVSYSGRVLGPCFACKGRGSKTFVNAAPVRAANRAKAQDRKVAQATNRVEHFAGKGERETAMVAWIQAKRDSFGFAGAMLETLQRFGDLTPAQFAAVERCMDKDASRAAQRAQVATQQQERVAGIDVANIVDCFQRAQEAGLKRFTLRFDGVHFQVDRNDPALIWVSASGYGSAKYGRIQGGVFKPGRDVTDAVIAQIALISADPMAAAKAYVQITSNCSVCGRHLENQDSVDAGMGPVCAGRINRPGLKFVEVKEGDF